MTIVDQNTGLRPSDWPLILIQFLNSIWNKSGGFLNSGMSFRPIGAHADGVDISGVVIISPPSSDAKKLLIQALGQNVRFTLDNSSPTTSKGFQLKAGDPPLILDITGNAIVKVIQEASTADLQYQWGS
jgi:hypothetical protein